MSSFFGALRLRAVVVVAVIAAVVASLAVAAGSSGDLAVSGPTTPRAAAARAHVASPLVHALGIDSRNSTRIASTPGARESSYCGSCTPPLVYHGGAVVGTAAKTGDLTVYSIYWAPSAASFSPNFETIVDGYLKNVAADSGKTANVYSVHTQYYGKGGSRIAYSMHFGGHIDDTAAFPANGCTPTSGRTVCITDTQLKAEIAKVITARGLPLSDAHMYSVFTPANVLSCDAPGSCSDNAFCGYHSALTVGGKQTLYSDEAYPDLDGCDTGQAPNGNPWADTAIKTESHEVSETITDPYGNGWTDAAGNENGDVCSQDYGIPIGSTSSTNPNTTKYNQLINGAKYYTQTEFSNAAYAKDPKNGCVLSSTAAALDPVKNVVTMSSQYDFVFNDSVPADTSTVTASLTTSGNPTQGDMVTFSVSATGTGCGTVSPKQVLTNAAGEATTTYTASTGNLNCVILASEVATGQAGNIAIANGTPPAPAKVDRIDAVSSNAVVSAINVSQRSFPSPASAPAAVLASEADKPAAAIGAPLAVHLDGPLLLTKPDKLNRDVATELTRALPAKAKVYLLGGASIISDAVATSITGLGFTPVRVAGADSPAIAVRIAALLNSPTTVIEAAKSDLVDTLLAATIAAKLGGTVLLTNGTTQEPATRAYLTAHPGVRYAVGADAVAADPAAEPVEGRDKDDLAAAVADEFFSDADGVGLITQANLGDGIGGAAELGANGEPFLFVHADYVPEYTANQVEAYGDRIQEFIVFGDPSQIPDQIVGYLGIDTGD